MGQMKAFKDAVYLPEGGPKRVGRLALSSWVAGAMQVGEATAASPGTREEKEERQ